MATGESLALRELLDDELSDQWVKQTKTGLKLDEQFLFGANALYDNVPVGPGDGVMRFRIATERYTKKRNS